MHVWLIKAGEALPTDETADRLKRMGLLAKNLTRNDHKVTWFNSTFNHSIKEKRFTKDHEIKISENYTLHLINAVSYKRNVSFKRIVHHVQTANKFQRKIEKLEKPDIIVCSMPTIELAESTVEFGRRNNIPVIIDIRDLWPDIYSEVLPKTISGLIKPYLNYSQSRLKKTLKNTTGITALTNGFLNWGLEKAEREKGQFDRVFNMGYLKLEEKIPNEIAHAFHKYKDKFVICFFGNLGRQFEFDPIIEAAKKLEKEKDIIFVICGTGEKLPDLKQKAANIKNVEFLGWVNKYQIQYLLSISSIGLAPYRDSINFRLNIPNKFGEYLSVGLPILLGVKGEMQELLNKEECGFYYKDAEELASYTMEIKNSTTIEKKLKINAINLFNKSFDAETVYKSYTDYLEEICADYNSEITRK